eukprot:1128069-Pelagomonas_calceolata.AAC.3
MVHLATSCFAIHLMISTKTPHTTCAVTCRCMPDLSTSTTPDTQQASAPSNQCSGSCDPAISPRMELMTP